ncbi:MAG: hypothetical protein JSV03_04700 [Planctomycetota bacterium]|nr:MAG: hypothetical protein JSV03_04700 [Planctomycetota bacterium]
MTSRERMLAALRRQTTDRTARHEHFWPETADVWVEQGLPADTDLADYFGSDLRGVDGYDHTLGLPEEVLEETEDWEIRRDGNGVSKKFWKKHSGVPEFTGEFAVQNYQQWNEYKDRLLDPAGRLNLKETVGRSHELRDGGYFVVWGVMGFWEAARDILGPETLLLNVAMEPAWIREIIEHLAALFKTMYEQFRQAGGYMDGLFFYEDLGYRNGMFMSPQSYRELIWPSHCRTFGRVHEDNIPVIVHCCGRVHQAIDSLIEAGMDCLQPLEAKAGMDLGELKARYGDRLSLMGNIDVTVLRTNDKDAVYREVTNKLKAGTEGSGYVFHSDHSIPPEVNLETYRFCLELVEEFDRQHARE